LDEFRQTYGATAKFYTEFAFKTKSLDPATQLKLGSAITSINGRADLLVVDELGRVHIFDFKVSRKSVGD
jgi:hypothetical protein